MKSKSVSPQPISDSMPMDIKPMLAILVSKPSDDEG